MGFSQFLFIEFGSITFGANTDESDYDLVVAINLDKSNEDLNELRRVRFFRDLPIMLQGGDMHVFAVWLAKNPILKIQFKSALWIDVSIAFTKQKLQLQNKLLVDAQSISFVLSCLEPLDELSTQHLNGVQTCQLIRRLVE